jgi:Na+-transporting methylmalonyl-CoA/oxaloacetate decarboxylase gamma subunit
MYITGSSYPNFILNISQQQKFVLLYDDKHIFLIVFVSVFVFLIILVKFVFFWSNVFVRESFLEFWNGGKQTNSKKKILTNCRTNYVLKIYILKSVLKWKMNVIFVIKVCGAFLRKSYNRTQDSMVELTDTHTHVCEDSERRAACRQFLASEANRSQTNFWREKRVLGENIWRAKRAFGGVFFFFQTGRNLPSEMSQISSRGGDGEFSPVSPVKKQSEIPKNFVYICILSIITQNIFLCGAIAKKKQTQNI